MQKRSTVGGHHILSTCHSVPADSLLESHRPSVKLGRLVPVPCLHDLKKNPKDTKTKVCAKGNKMFEREGEQC